MREIRKRIFILLLEALLVFPMFPKLGLAEKPTAFIEAPDPDLADLQAAKDALESAEYPAANQEEQGTEAAATSYVEQVVKQAVNNEAIGLSIHVEGYTAPKAGDADYPDGTNGQIAFTVTLTKGAQVQSTARLTLAIKATPYAGISNQQVMDKAASLLAKEFTIDLKLGTYGEAFQNRLDAYFNEVLAECGDLDYVYISQGVAKPGTEIMPVQIYIEKGLAYYGTVVNVHLNEERDPDLATVKTAIEHGDYSGIRQSAYDDGSFDLFVRNRALDAIQNSGVVPDRIRIAAVTGLDYVPSITGDANHPSGTDGSFTFTITFFRVWQVWTTSPITVPILATTFHEVNEQALAAVKEVLVNGEVDVAFGASQADKTAAVQSYVNRLLTRDPEVTASVAYNSDTGNYDVALVRGDVSDSKSLTMTVNEAADPDIAIVSAARAAAESASYPGTTQAAHGDEAAAKSYVEDQARAAVHNSEVTVTVAKVGYVAPIAGDGDHMSGTDGSYTFTVTVAKGVQSQTTAQHTIAITATAFNGVPNVQAVAAAKAALVDGRVDVVFKPSQADKTAAVQSYVNRLLTGDAAGVTAIVTFNSVSGSYDVALSKGARTDSTSLHVTFNEAPDPDIAIVQAAKAAVESAEYPAANQEEQGTEAAATSYVEQVVKQAVNNDGVGLVLHVEGYTAPKAGDADYPDGTNGQIAFTVTLTKGAQVQSTARLTLAIKATPYAGISNQQVMDKAASLLAKEFTIDLKLGTYGEAFQNRLDAYFNEVLAECGDLDYVYISQGVAKPGTEIMPVQIYIEKGLAYYGTVVNVHLNEERDPDLATVKTAIEHGDYSGIRQSAYDDGSFDLFVRNRALDAIQNSGVVPDRIRIAAVTGLDYVPSITGDANHPSGTDGSFTFTITFFRVWQVWTTAPITVPILATTFHEVNEQALAAVKEVLVNGEVDVAFGASQADKTAAVQSYVNRLLTRDPEVTASVAYNSDTGNYDVALVRGDVSDSKSLTMTVNEAADPDIAIVSAARAAAESASYPGTTQAAHGDEAAAKSYVEDQARAAVHNSEVTVTVAKVGYVAPIAGDGDHMSGTDGSYTFTVTVAKGVQSQTTAQYTIAITATAFNGVPNVQAVAAAKAALVDGRVDVVFKPSQADKTAAVQSYVNRLLTGDAAGVTAIVTFNSVSGSYDVALSKGARTDSTSLHVTFNEAPDPDIAIMQAAKAAVESAEYPAANQEEQGTEAAATSYVEQVVKQAVNNDGVGLVLHVEGYTAPKAGDADYPDGTNGQIAFTVTLTKGAQVQSTARLTLAIKATPYAGISNQQVMDKAASLLAKEFTIDLKLGTYGEAFQNRLDAYFNEVLAECGDLDYVYISQGVAKPGTEIMPVQIYIEKGLAYYGTVVNVHLNEERDPDLATVKTAIEHGDYSGIRQSAYDDGSFDLFVRNRALDAIQNSGVVPDRIRIAAVTGLDYVPSITGDANHPSGTDGSFTFTITFFRVWQVWTTAPITVPILATTFEGLSNPQAVAAAKTALIDGEVDVAFGASQADKTEAVQSYVNGLLVGDAAGVTATVTYNSGSGNYEVALSKGSASDSKSLAMTVNEAADPDIAMVAAAKAAAEGASYSSMTQAAATSESVIASALKATAEAAVNNNAVTVTITKVSYTAPIAGDGDHVGGTDGSYVFTVTVAKGLQSQTTAQQTIAITATALNGVTNVQAVAVAKAALVNGSVNVGFGASQADKTAAVQSYVNGLLVGDAAGVAATVTYNSGSGNYEVALSKGSASDSKSLAMTVNESADPDIAMVAAAKAAAEGASYSSMTQAAATSESVIAATLKATAEAAVNNNAVTVTVAKVTYTAPIAGDGDHVSGTDGSYDFTVTVAKGLQSQTTAQQTIAITATPFTGLSDVQAVAAAKTALIDGEVDVAFGASQADKTAAVQGYVNDLLTGDASGVAAVVTYNSVSGNYDVALSKGSASDSKSLAMAVNVSADPDIAMVTAAKTAAEGASYSSMTQAAATSESVIAAALKATAEAAVNNNAVTVTVTKVTYTAPIAGDGDHVGGTDGSYVFTVTVAKGLQSQTTAQQTIAITATPFIGLSNAQAVAAAKTALIDGEVDVAFGASQADKTEAVQSYVNGLLVGDAAGVTATVTYNSGSGNYDVALSKGSASDSKSLAMVVNESADPDIAMVTAAKAAAEGASYSSMTQAAATSESVIAATLKATAEAAVNNSAVTVTVAKVTYTAPIAGDGDHVGGTDGSYVFTVTVAKGLQSQTTEQQTIAITATPFTGLSDAQAVAAAKTALIDGEVDVAFGASQADKSAAVQSYVNGLLVGDAAGVAATVTYNSVSGNYDVALSKGSASDSKSLAMVVNESADPDIAMVTAAKAAAEGASYSSMTQAAATSESVIASALKATAEAAVNNNAVTVTVTKVTYTAPIAGDGDHVSGTDGSYVFTVTVAKGLQSQTTAQQTIAITATPFTGLSDVQAVAAAKTALIDGEVDVAFGASQADRTAAVQSYVNSLLVGDAAGVTATVTYNSGSGNYEVALSKGSASDSKSLAMVVNESADPDIAIVTAAKAAAEGASYSSMTQAAATSESVIAATLKATAEAAVNNNAVTVTVAKVSYTSPIAGDGDHVGGTDGSYVFTITVAKGLQSQTTAQQTIAITATAFNGVTNVQAVAVAKAALVNGSVNVAFGASQADKTAAVQSYVNGLLVGDATGVTATVAYNNGKYEVAISKGSASDSKSLAMTVNESADPDIAMVTAAKAAAEGASYSSMTQAAATSESVIASALKATAEAAVNNNAVTVTVAKVSYTAPIVGDGDHVGGTDGSYVFTVTVAKGSQSQTTAQQTIAITATPFTGLSDAQAVAAAKTALVNGSVNVAFGASQADKTEAVQSYVNGLLVGDATGVTATVAYNNGKYEVAISKGSASDSKSLAMTVNEAADPDIAMVAAAKTAAEGASYSSMTQAAATSESVIASALKATAEAAVMNSSVAVTINKVSYTAPIAGTSANPSGTDGSYVFTVTLTKGSQSQTTGPIKVNISATPDTNGGTPGGGTPGGGTPGGGTPGGGTPGGGTPGGGTPGGSTPGGSTPGGGTSGGSAPGGGTPGGGTSGSGSTFADINKTDWFFNAVTYIQQRGLMSGTSETAFSPQLTASRAMIATVLYRMAGSPHVTGVNTFTDVPSGTWYTDAINWAAQKGMVSGYGDKRFGIDDAVTREQLVALLYRYAQQSNLDISVAGDLSDFADKDKISAWATDSMKWAVGKGLITGKGNGMLDPSGTATRAEIAMILMLFLKQ